MKIVQSLVAATTWYLCALGSTHAKEGSLRSRANDHGRSMRCRLTSIDSVEEYGCTEIVNGEETSGFYHVVPPKDLIQENRNEVMIGRLLVDITGATIEKGEILLAADATFTVATDEQAHRHLQTLVTKSLGTRSLLYVRVSAPDSSHPKSLLQMQQTVFRTNSTSFKTQYEGCSNGKLKWTNGGGADIMLSKPIASYLKPANLVDEAQQKLEALYGKPANQIADHVFFCNPPNSISFTAVAGVNSWRVNSHASICTSLSTLMHEIGHNIGLLHSGEGSDTYGDFTGIMGPGSVSETGPLKCFNGYKNFQLRWYEDRQLKITDASTPTKMNLTAFVDYNRTAATDRVLVVVMDNLYLQYNRAKGLNAGTGERPDALTVTNLGTGNSLLYAGLTAGQQYTGTNFKGTGKTLFIAACRRLDGNAGKPDVMEIAIGYDKSWC